MCGCATRYTLCVKARAWKKGGGGGTVDRNPWESVLKGALRHSELGHSWVLFDTRETPPLHFRCSRNLEGGSSLLDALRITGSNAN